MEQKQEIVLVVDDLRLFDPAHSPFPIVYATSSKQALDILNEKFDMIREIWLDHDLGIVDGEKDEVTPVLNWLEEKGYNQEANHIEVIRILTNNPVGFTKIGALGRYFFIGITPKHTGLRQVHSEE